MSYVASFSNLPHPAGKGAILRVQPDGTSSVVVGDLTAPIDLTLDAAGRLYVLEFVQPKPGENPYFGETGRLLRFQRNGDRWEKRQVLAEGLPHPTAMLFGPDGSLYVSARGAFSPVGSGAVIRYDDLASRK